MSGSRTFSACLLIFLSASSADGTTLFELVDKNGIVMAADGLAKQSVDYEVGSRHVHRVHDVDSEPKIVICGERFLCGVVGQNPKVNQEDNFYFDFGQWMSQIRPLGRVSVSAFAEAVRQKAFHTFAGKERAIPELNIWEGEDPDLDAFEIVGYEGSHAERCEVLVRLNKTVHKLEFPHRKCEDVAPGSSAGGVHLVGPADAYTDNVVLAFTQGSTQQRKRDAISSAGFAAARRCFPDLSPAFQRTIGLAASLVKVEEHFNPEHVGRQTLVGVIFPGRPPSVVQIRRS